MKLDKERYIDLSDIKEEELDKTVSFTDLMSRSDKKRRAKEKKIEEQNKNEDLVEVTKIEKETNVDDIEEMLDERKKSTAELSKQLEKAKKEINKKNTNEEDNIAKTQVLEFTRQMKYNFEETAEENVKKKKKGISPLNVIGEVNLLCIGYYIYLLLFTSFQNRQRNYLFDGGLIVLLVLLFGISTISNKKISKIFNILNIIVIIIFIAFNAYTFIV